MYGNKSIKKKPDGTMYKDFYDERQTNGQWLKSISFKLSIIEHDEILSLDKLDHVECISYLTKPED